ncbi:MAG: redoxin domain-containing protein [Chitinophagaceae bacterium]|nr:redoxin domain-containing protein [Chitinophagaceae bacterium]
MKKYVLIAAILCTVAGTGQTVTLSGQLPDNADSVTVYVWDHFFNETRAMVTPYRSFSAPCQSGTFSIQLDSINNPVYFSLYSIKNSHKNPIPALRFYLAEPGDNIMLEIGSKKQVQVTGKGSAKYAFQYRSDTLTYYWDNRRPFDRSIYNDWKNKKYLDYLHKGFNLIDTFLARQIQLLEEYKTQLSEKVWLQLQADLLGKSIERKFQRFRSTEIDIKLNGSGNGEQSDLNRLCNLLTERVNNTHIPIPDAYLAKSKNYPIGIVQMTMATQRQTDTGSVGKRFEENFKGVLRDKLWAVYLVDNFDHMPDADSVLAVAIQAVKTPAYKAPLLTIQNRLTRGAPAYNFMLEDSNGRFRTLSEFKGKNVFLDFWFTGCSGCVMFYKKTLKSIEEVFSKDTSMVFISISVDTDKETWLKSIADDNYTSTKAINLRTGTMGREHPVINWYAVSSYPKSILLDKNGNIYHNTTAVWDKEKLLSLLQEASSQ